MGAMVGLPPVWPDRYEPRQRFRSCLACAYASLAELQFRMSPSSERESGACAAMSVSVEQVVQLRPDPLGIGTTGAREGYRGEGSSVGTKTLYKRAYAAVFSSQPVCRHELRIRGVDFRLVPLVERDRAPRAVTIRFGVGLGVALGVGLGVALGVGLGVGLGVTVGAAVGVGVGAGVTNTMIGVGAGVT